MKFVRRIGPVVLLVAIVAAGVALFVERDPVLDWWMSRDYHPSSAMQQMVSDDQLTPYAKRLLYANRPEIEGKEAFNAHCSNTVAETTVLGCYTGNRRGIYVYEVTDARLNGVEEVTTAHEMLHQAYDRLSSSERSHINALLQAYYDSGAPAALKSQIDGYKQTEPTQLVNEMHSIFGTQADTLPPELETYYQRYFGDRAKIVAFYHQYQSEFDKRRAQIEAYDQQLQALKVRIDADKAELTAREKTLSQQRQQLDGYLAANQISTYNAAVPGFNQQVNAYRALLNATNDLITQYNQLLAQRNAIAVQAQQLQQALDSHITSTAGQK